MTVHAVAVVDSIRQCVAVCCVIVADGNVVVLRGSTWRYVKKVGVRRVHQLVMIAGVETKRFQRQVAGCVGWRCFVCSGVIRGH